MDIYLYLITVLCVWLQVMTSFVSK